MSWLFSQALVEEYLPENSLDGAQFAPLSGSRTQQAYCAPDKMTDFSRLSRFGMTYKPLTENRGEELLTLYLAGFHAKTSAQQEKAQELTENEAELGGKWRASFVKWSQDLCLWRTHQCSLLGDLEPFSETWPQWGLMHDGECWEQQTLAQTISVTAFGLLPTPNARDWKDGKTSGNRKSPGLGVVVYWPTPRASDFKGAISAEAMSKAAARGVNPNLPEATAASVGGGRLNPTWVEWLMGWPLGWTDLKPLETDKFHCAPQQHGES
jgi:hypothetical protein